MHDRFVISLQRFVGISSGGLGRLGRRRGRAGNGGLCFPSLVRLSGLELLMLCLVCAPAAATPLISELFYDAVGSDNGRSFVEIYGEPGSDLTGFTLEGVNGSNGAGGPVIELAGTIPADGIFVVADMDGDGFSLVVEADQLANFDFQNGPDSVVLYDGPEVLDAVGYGDFDPEEFYAGEGMPAPDPPAGSSLARVFADVDSDDNSLDFEVLDTPTPGSAPLQSVPEPGSALLGSAGLLGLALLGRRGRARLG